MNNNVYCPKCKIKLNRGFLSKYFNYFLEFEDADYCYECGIHLKLDIAHNAKQSSDTQPQRSN